MEIKDMQVNTQLIDATELDQDEANKIAELLGSYKDGLVFHLMQSGGATALSLAAGLALRMVKANQGIQTFTLRDMKV